MNQFVAIKNKDGVTVKINKNQIIAITDINMINIGDHCFVVSFVNGMTLDFHFESKEIAQTYWDMF